MSSSSRGDGSRGGLGAWAVVALAVLAACNPARDVPIFLWHSVGEGSPQDEYDVPADEFDRELSTIESFGATTITLDQLFDARAGKGKLPERAVILTFDDGRACLYRAVMPILLKHRMVAESFVLSSYLADDEAHRRVERDERGVHPFLIGPELSQMVTSGAFSVQSHSVTHRRHTDLSLEEKRTELTESRRALSERLGVPVSFYAYPFGGFDSEYRDAAENAGYRGALAVGKGPGTRYGMLRVSLRRGGEQTVSETLGRFFGAPVR
jgi:peptidoglycan/xylan/chitin deacetylase (PgdA/CDA1 family)